MVQNMSAIGWTNYLAIYNGTWFAPRMLLNSSFVKRPTGMSNDAKARTFLVIAEK